MAIPEIKVVSQLVSVFTVGCLMVVCSLVMVVCKFVR